jgi:hypothetical protein
VRLAEPAVNVLEEEARLDAPEQERPDVVVERLLVRAE